MPTLQECIDRYHAAMAVRDPSRPIRVHRVVTMTPACWRRNVERERAGMQRRFGRLADAGDRVGVMVGIVIDTVEVEP